jgi:hypothetical protein
MPAYEYDLVEPGTDLVLGTVTLIRPVESRDQVRLRRRSVPRQVCVRGHARNPQDAAQQVVAGYHKLEQRHGSRFKSRFSADQVKAAYGRKKRDD